MTQPQDPPKIEFPCDYPIKVVGDAAADFKQLVVDTMSVHAGTIIESKVSVRASSKGTFQSVTVVITATGVDQLQAIHTDLQATGRVKMVL
jgi:hypothetical protein